MNGVQRMGSFKEFETNDNHERQESLRADQNTVFISKKERVSSAASCSYSASMTVEAAFVLPIFIFCMVNILMIFQMVEYRSRVLAAVHQTGNEIARNACLRGITPEGMQPAEALLSAAYLPSGVSGRLESGISDDGCIVDGIIGISYIGSLVLAQDDIIDIRASYSVRPAYAGFGWEGARMFVRYYGRGWTGYNVTRTQGEDKREERMVYITKTGEVYHLSRGCSSLNPSIKGIKYDDADSSRNLDGHRYGVCPYCGDHSPGGSVYVTDYGTCYHTSPSCKGLRRTVYCIPLSEAGGRRPCSICGGE